MRRILTLGALLLAIGLGTGVAAAQTRVPLVVPNVQINPNVIKTPTAKVPIIKVIPPSMAINNALALMPQATALGVKLRGPIYIVKLKQGNQVIQVRVDAVSGIVSQ
jgi:hypothetical protein